MRVTLSRVALLAAVLLGCVACDRQSADSKSGRMDDRPTFIAYIPADAGRKAPLVLALSPSGDARTMLKAWQPIADQRGWIVVASKQFRNGIDYEIIFRQLTDVIDELTRDYPVDANRIAVMGLSGGAMAGHAFAQVAPGRVRAVIANCGMMEEAFQRDDYPRGKLVAFVASPTDFRFGAMQRDRAFLEGKGWTSTWIEFSGGHTLAPTAALDRAAAWLEEHW